jgi:hypothetical protein
MKVSRIPQRVAKIDPEIMLDTQRFFTKAKKSIEVTHSHADIST